MSKPKAKRQEFTNPEAGPVISARFALSLLLIVLGIAWVVYYYVVVRVDPLAATPGKAGGPSFMADLEGLELPDRLRPGRASACSSPPTRSPRWAAAAASWSACSAAS